MLPHFWPRTLASVSVASTKVVLSIQGLGVAESRGKVSSGLRYVGWVTYLFYARVVQPARTCPFQGPYYIACSSPHLSYPCAFSGRHTASYIQPRR